jgi:hypothetical protein
MRNRLFLDSRNQFEDFWAAVNSSDAVINFSTPPNWLCDATWTYPDDPTAVTWSYETGATCNAAGLTGYYGRLAAWLAEGSFTDEYGVVHGGGPGVPLSQWEVLNEVAHEHAHTAQSYTRDC